MKLTRQQLDRAVEQHILDSTQAQRLLEFLRDNPAPGARFDFTHLLYYLGGLVAIGAMTLFMNLGWESFGGWGVFAIALLYLVAGLGLASRFERLQHPIPAGICATFAVCLTPLAVFGLQQELGFWPDGEHYRDYHRYIEWHWLMMELATLAVGAMVAWRYRYPFLLMPIAVTLWYLSMDLVAMINDGDYDFKLRSLVSIYFGLLVMFGAFWVDIRSRHSLDYAFWLYLFGVLTFWGGLTMQDSNSELGKLGYFGVNLLLIGLGALLVRRVFVVFGGLGCCAYLGHLAFDLFEDSWLFPIALSLIGLLIIYLGIVWQRHEQRISRKLQTLLPGALRELLQARRF
ncbi:DUF2157 domain-containing protein [Motiliproteus sp.]|uniref:DUF2157 domain-containing protein n=1 Tax=Motiliproteus sp. TaxID=1898955 RepID=UPI003BAD14CE